MSLTGSIIRAVGAIFDARRVPTGEAPAEEHRWFADGIARGALLLGARTVPVFAPERWRWEAPEGTLRIALLGRRTLAALADGDLGSVACVEHLFGVYREARERLGGGRIVMVVDTRLQRDTSAAAIRAVTEHAARNRNPRDLTVLLISPSSRWLGAVFSSRWVGAGRFECTAAPLREVLQRTVPTENADPDDSLFARRDGRLEAALRALIELSLDHDAPLVAVPDDADDVTRDVFRAMRVVQAELRELARAQRGAQEALERKVLERTAALEAAKEEADRAVMAQQGFLSTMNHEVRTPLNGVIGAARLMERWALAPEQRELVETLMFSAQHLQALVDDVLDYAKVEAGALDLDMVPIDLHRKVRGVARAFRVRAEEKGVALSVRTDPAVPTSLRGDGTRINQVLFNLVSNAVKFTERGEVELRLDLESETPARARVALRVRDTGPGVRPELVPTLFEAFNKATRVTSRRYGGTGLGLAISRRLARLHGGELVVESAVGEGTTFTLRLDLERAASQPARRERPSRDLAGLRVLLVEDNPMNQIVATRFLRLWNAEITTVDDGEQGLARMAQDRFDVVLLDLHMPVMDGFEVLARIREAGDPTPVLALSADASDRTLDRVLAAGAAGFVSKPFQPDDLFERLEALRVSARGAAGAPPAAPAPGA